MNVIFVEPAFPLYQRDFVRALHGVGARVFGIGERPAEHLDDELKNWLAGYEQIGSVTDEQALYRAVRGVQEREWVDRIETTIEAHVMPVARVRAECTIPGTSVRTAFLCRDKPEMKRVLREAGVPCARSSAVASVAEAREFAEAVGFPIVLKPRDAAGAAGTSRLDDMQSLVRALDEAGVDQGAPAALEEFVDGHEGFYDTLAIDGRVGHEFISHYYPNVLEGMRERWISPQIVTTNRLDVPAYEELRELAGRVIEVLGIGTSATHMEWFFGSKGLRFSEIACRPPGVAHWEIYNAANEFDLYHEWAMAIVNGCTDRTPSRRYAAGIIALRPSCDGHISGYDGLEEVEQRYGECIVGAHFPAPGTATQPVEAGYMANAWLRMRHPDYDELREILDFVGRTVKVRAR